MMAAMVGFRTATELKAEVTRRPACLGRRSGRRAGSRGSRCLGRDPLPEGAGGGAPPPGVRRSAATRSRAKAKARAFFRGVRCAAGPPGLAAPVGSCLPSVAYEESLISDPFDVQLGSPIDALPLDYHFNDVVPALPFVLPPASVPYEDPLVSYPFDVQLGALPYVLPPVSVPYADPLISYPIRRAARGALRGTAVGLPGLPRGARLPLRPATGRLAGL